MCIFNALGEWSQAGAARQAGEYNRLVYQRSAQMAGLQGQEALRQHEAQSLVALGNTIAGLGYAGGRLDEGTPAHVMASAYDQMAYDAEIIKWNTAASVQDLLNRGEMAWWEGERRYHAGQIAGYGSLLTDTSQAGFQLASLFSSTGTS